MIRMIQTIQMSNRTMIKEKRFMKNIILVSSLFMALIVITSCSHPSSGGSSDTTSEDTTVSTYVNQLSQSSKKVYIYKDVEGKYFEQIYTYNPGEASVATIETFNYTTYDSSAKTGTYTSEVKTADTVPKTLGKSSVTVINNGSKYEKTISYSKISNGVEEKYLESIEIAEDKDFSRVTFRVVYAPNESNAIKELVVREYDDSTLLPSVECKYYVDDIFMSDTFDLSNAALKEVVLYEYDNNKPKMVISFGIDKNATDDSNIIVCVSYYTYVDYEEDYITKSVNTAICSNYGILKGIIGGTKDTTDLIFDELPSYNEAVTYKDFEVNGSEKSFPVVIATTNSDWEIERKITYSYAKMPKMTNSISEVENYYPCDETIWSRKVGEDSSTIILEKIYNKKQEYFKNSNGKLCLREQIYLDKSKYATTTD